HGGATRSNHVIAPLFREGRIRARHSITTPNEKNLPPWHSRAASNGKHPKAPSPDPARRVLPPAPSRPHPKPTTPPHTETRSQRARRWRWVSPGGLGPSSPPPPGGYATDGTDGGTGTHRQAARNVCKIQISQGGGETWVEPA